ncbi:MAG: hypothetical protein ACR2NX_07530 [Chthoniobacterales bacterium]
MNRRVSLIRSFGRTPPAFAAWWLVASFFFAGLLASSPGLHHWLHKDSASAAHECAVTLLRAGKVEHSACEPPLVAPLTVLTEASFCAPRILHLAALLAFTRLEHAPPALS